MRRTTIVLPLLLAAALAAAGCGSDSGGPSGTPSTKEYRSSFIPVADEIAKINVDLVDAFGGTAGPTPSEQAKSFSSLADRLHKVADKLDGTTPPADPSIRTNQAALVQGLNASADDLAAFAKATGNNDKAGADAALTRLRKDAPQISKPQSAIKAKLKLRTAYAKTTPGG